MRRSALPVLLAVTTVGTLGVGIGAAATKKPPTFKACASSKNVLSLVNAKGKCAKGAHSVTLGAAGPQGIQGVQGTAGITGPKGPGTVDQIDYKQTTGDGAATAHVFGTAGPISLQGDCYGTTTVNAVLRVTADQTFTAAGFGYSTGGNATVHGDSAAGGNIDVLTFSSATNTAGGAAFTVHLADGRVASVVASFLLEPVGGSDCEVAATVTFTT